MNLLRLTPFIMMWGSSQIGSLAHVLTQSSTHSLPHSLTHSLTHSPTHSLTLSLTHSLTHSLPRSLTHSPTHSLPHSLTPSLTHSLPHSLAQVIVVYCWPYTRLNPSVSNTQVIDSYCGQAFRVLALAKGVLKGRERQAWCLMSQEQLEKKVERLELLGLLVLSNHLHPDSQPTITELQQQ